MGKIRISHYMRTDFRRLVRGYGFYIAIAGVVAALLLSLFDGGGLTNENVVSTYVDATDLSGMSIVYIFCAFAFGISLGDDLENRYVRYQIIRGGKIRYVVSRIAVIYESSIAVMITGSWLFMLLLRTMAPWANLTIDSLDVLTAGQFAGLIQSGHYMAYCLMYALNLGLLAGALSVFAAFISLFISNKVTTLVIPILAYQLLMEFSGSGKVNVLTFRSYAKLFANDLAYFIFCLLLSLIPTILLGVGIYKKLNTRL